jgi:phosphoribosylaminoimidazole-succinocarboxamide synthase
MIAGLTETNYQLPQQVNYFKGKVREVYSLNDSVVMIATDRISAFDVILPRAIPFKGQVLNQIAAKFLIETKDICPNWLLAVPDPNVAIGKKCEPIRIEMVIRGYLAGHAWRTYKSGARVLCGVTLPDGLRENDKLPHPIITPAAKAEHGHDEDISKEEIIDNKLVDRSTYQKMEEYTYQLFERGSQIAAKQGLILVDTKYEFGLYQHEVTLIDEIHTPDSSRYFYADSYETNQRNNHPQKHLSKEFVREWLIENNFMGLENQQVPTMSDEVVNSISERYIELYEKVTGEKFIKRDYDDIVQSIEKNIIKALTL